MSKLEPLTHTVLNIAKAYHTKYFGVLTF